MHFNPCFYVNNIVHLFFDSKMIYGYIVFNYFFYLFHYEKPFDKKNALKQRLFNYIKPDIVKWYKVLPR